jgi:thiamine-monophosphate kinase
MPLPLAHGPEFDLIRRFLPAAPAAIPHVPVGPGDDCAVVAAGDVAISTDMSVEGVHFRRDWLAADEIGYRAAAAALSDLAAVAARPVGVLASLALPAADAGDFAVALMEGVRRAADAAGAAVLGGDVAATTGPLVIDVTVVGACPAPVLRSGAAPGDEVWVTGTLGGAAAAAAAWLAGTQPDAAARARFAAPEPRVREARWLAEHGVPTAMLDLSDGLAGDAGHLAAAGGVALVLDADALPRHPSLAALAPAEALRLAACGGEDYELCFTARSNGAAPHAEAFLRAFGVALTRVGRVEAGSGVWWEDAGGRRPVERGGFQHFGGET